MKLFRGNRILSPVTFALLLVFGLTVYGGANILGFQALTNRIWFGPADGSLKSVLASVSAWTDTSSVSTAARTFMLEVILAETPNDNAAIEGVLKEMAAASPVATATWVTLAEARKVRGASMESVLEAFRMSALTGSHEGYFMLRRAIFGLEQWNVLSDADRRTVARDVLLSIGPANNLPLARYRAILKAKPEAERDDIMSTLSASGWAGGDDLLDLGE